MPKRIHQSALAVTLDGTIILNLAHLYVEQKPEAILRRALVVASSRHTYLAFEGADQAKTDICDEPMRTEGCFILHSEKDQLSYFCCDASVPMATAPAVAAPEVGTRKLPKGTCESDADCTSPYRCNGSGLCTMGLGGR